jgi:threonine dehydrogenase-like Zn-dependent dehydrogenase
MIRGPTAAITRSTSSIFCISLRSHHGILNKREGIYNVVVIGAGTAGLATAAGTPDLADVSR